MRVENRFLLSQEMNHFDGIATLPEQMAEVAVRADFLAHRLAKLHQRAWIIDNKIRMHLQRNAMYAVLAREFRSFLPVRNNLFFPLPILHFRVFRRPSIRDPVRLRVGWRAPGAAGKSYNHAHVEPFRQQNRLAKALAIVCSMFFVRMNRVSVTAQRGYVNATVLKFLFPCFRFSRIRQQFVDRTMSGARIATSTYLHSLEAERTHAVQHLIERQLFVNGIEDTDRDFAE